MGGRTTDSQKTGFSGKSSISIIGFEQKNEKSGKRRRPESKGRGKWRKNATNTEPDQDYFRWGTDVGKKKELKEREKKQPRVPQLQGNA